MATGRQFDLAYMVEQWDDEDSHVEELIALAGDYRVARAAYEEAVKRRPSRIVTLRQKTDCLLIVVGVSDHPRGRRPHLIANNIAVERARRAPVAQRLCGVKGSARGPFPFRRGENEENGIARRCVHKVGGRRAALLDCAGEDLLAGNAVDLAERVNVRICEDD